MEKILIYGHRGASAYRPENTLEAFSLALEQGADGIELDVHLSKDGEIVVAHDERLERVSDGAGEICDYTLEELKKFNFNKMIPDSPICRIPTLTEVYQLLQGTDVLVNVELKTNVHFYLELPKKLLDLERQFSMEGRILYSSFNHYSLAMLRDLDPKAEIGLLYDTGMIDPWVYANYVGADAIHPNEVIIAALPDTVKKCHENGVKVNVWTVNEPKMIQLMLDAGVDGIITNNPDVVLKARDKN